MTGASDVVCDLGGTNVRFAPVADDGAPGPVWSRPLADYPDFASALRAFVDDTRVGPANALAIGAAGPVSAGAVTLTNAPWTLSREALQPLTQSGDVLILNDLQAVAHAIPALAAADVRPLRRAAGPMAQAAPAIGAAPAIAINAGTGFGASTLHPVCVGRDVVWHAAATEAGHMSLPRAAPLPVDLPRDATIEDVLSGRGLAALANRLAERDGAFAAAGDVVRASASNTDASNTEASNTEALAALDQFGWLLGRACRDLVLAHGAWGGVYLVGSVARAWMSAGRWTPFETGFQSDGPMAALVDATPVSEITRAEPALVGLARVMIGRRRTAAGRGSG